MRSVQFKPAVGWPESTRTAYEYQNLCLFNLEEDLGARETRAVRDLQPVLTHRSRELNLLASMDPSYLGAVHHDAKLHGSPPIARWKTPHTNYPRQSHFSDNRRRVRDGQQNLVITMLTLDDDVSLGYWGGTGRPQGAITVGAVGSAKHPDPDAVPLLEAPDCPSLPDLRRIWAPGGNVPSRE
jgi:hypothetical protein